MIELTKEKMQVLIDNILLQAKHYLNSADEFYPFGTVIDKDQNIKPVSFYSGEEFPDSNDVLKNLEEALKKGIDKKDYLSAAMGVDVYLKVNNDKKTAIEIKLYRSAAASKLYFIYYKKDGEYFFEPHNLES